MPSVKLSPLFNDEQLDNDGLPLSGGLVYWYLAGTTTPITVYAESSGSVPNTNPVVLNTRGEPANPIWLPTGQAYKAVLKDSVGNIIRTVDNISGINDTSAPTISEWLLYAGPATYINATQFSVTGDATAIFDNGRRIKATVSGTDRYATVSGSPVYGAGVTTVTLSLDSGVLDASLNTVYYGFLDPAYPSFSVKPAELSTPNAIFWDGAGNVGIGTTSPAVKCDVSGQGRFVSPGSGTSGGVVIRQPLGDASGGIIQWVDNAGVVQKGYVTFSTASDFIVVNGSGSELLRATNGGNVGIGTASPGQKLSVAGTIESTSGGIKFPDGTTQASSGLGFGQTWQTFTVSGGSPQRSTGTNFTNSTGKPIAIAISVIMISGQGLTLTVAGTAVASISGNSATTIYQTIYAVIPNGATYNLSYFVGSGSTLNSWAELR